MVLLSSKETSNLKTNTQPSKAEVRRESSQSSTVKEVSYMTTNQIRYAELQESRRHSLASESIEARKAAASQTSAGAAVAQAGAQYASVAESSRHNREMEDIGWNQYYSLSSLQGAQGQALLQDSATRRAAQESTERHYQRQDAISGAKAATDAVFGGIDTIRKFVSPRLGGK